MSNNFSRGLAVSVCAAAICMAAPATADTHQWSNFHWQKSTEGDFVALDVEYNVKGVWVDDLVNGGRVNYVKEAYDKWRHQNVLPILSVNYLANSSIDTRKCNPVDGKVIICSDSYGFQRGGWLGVATAWVDSLGHFQQVTVKYNDTFYDSSYNDPNERRFVTCHEQGHSLGLGHLDENFDNTNLGSCMDYTSDVDGGAQGPSNLNPDSLDSTDLNPVDTLLLNSDAMYGSNHVFFNHGGSTDDGGGGGGGPPTGKGPKKLEELYPEWGAIVGYDGLGRPNEFLQVVAPGLTKRTHVLWSREARPVGTRR